MGEADTRACFLAHRVEGGEGVLLEEQRETGGGELG
jgi:hypothetical protein